MGGAVELSSCGGIECRPWSPEATWIWSAGRPACHICGNSAYSRIITEAAACLCVEVAPRVGGTCLPMNVF